MQDNSQTSQPVEPAVYYEKGTLYLALTCFQSGIAVFSTQPTGNIHSWKWQYNGWLVASSDASKLGLNGTIGFTQGELAKGENGQLLAIMSPFSKGTGNPGAGAFVNHFGCWVFQVDSFNPPSLAKDSSGNPKVLASVTASDLGAEGPGSCGYDPNSATGIVIARRHLKQVPKTTTINETGIKP